MNRILTLAIVLFAVLPSQRSSGITYKIEPRDGVTPGWSLDAGFITTDGTIGEIGLSNFTSWSMEFTSPAGSNKINSESGGAYLIVESFVPINPFVNHQDAAKPALIATQDQLVASRGFGSLSLLFLSADSYSDSFIGNLVSFSPGGARLVDNDIDPSTPYGAFHTTINSTTLPSAPPTNQNTSALVYPSSLLAIGTVQAVPEPGTWSSLSALIAILAMVRWRKLAPTT